MKGDFSRLTFDPGNHYAGVRWQQGRPVTDADENEAHQLAAYRVETEAIDVIGGSGVPGAPRENPGFGLSVSSGETGVPDGDLLIGAGRLYVDGILCENDAPVAYGLQPDLPNPPAIPGLLADAPLGLAYLEVFKRHLTYHDRDGMRDPALNGVDTTTRLRTTWQVRVAPLPSVKLAQAVLDQLVGLAGQIAKIDEELAGTEDLALREKLIRERDNLRRQSERLAEENGLTCAGDLAEWQAVIDSPSGVLQVSTVPAGEADDPCDVPPGGGYQRGENQFYIVEVHSVPAGNGRNGATFKWSRDNGSIVARILAVGSATSGSATGTVFSVDSVQRDDYLGIHNEEWVEYVDDTSELNGQPGILARVLAADKNLNRVTLDRSLAVNLDANPKLRKWDQTGATATDSGVAMNTVDGQVVELEGGIQVSFSAGTYRPGDFWQFDARAVTGQISFPSTPQAPDGVVRHYARLGVVALQQEQLHLLLDCRKVFPPLTAITAADVSFDNSQCNLPGVRTVQEAIDALCARPTGGGEAVPCFTVGKNGRFQDLQKAVDALRAEGFRQICLCLMPGEILVLDNLIVEADPKEQLALSIHGCARSLLALQREWKVSGLAAFELKDLDLFAPGLVQERVFISVVQTGRFTMANCRVRAVGERGFALVGLSEVGEIDIHGNQISFSDFNGVELGREIFAGFEIGQIFEMPRDVSFDDRDYRVFTAPLLTLNTAERKVALTQIRKRISQFANNFTTAEDTAYTQFMNTLSDPRSPARLYIDRLKAIQRASSLNQVALVNFDGDGDVKLSGNRFGGLVSLGGFPDPEPVNIDLLFSLLERLKGRPNLIAPGGGRFHADGNVFSGLVWSGDVWKMLDELIGNETAALQNVHSVVHLSDNQFNQAGNQVAGGWLTVTGNTLRGTEHPILLTAASQVSAFSGNTGLPRKRDFPNVFNLSGLTQQAANPGLDIISTN